MSVAFVTICSSTGIFFYIPCRIDSSLTLESATTNTRAFRAVDTIHYDYEKATDRRGAQGHQRAHLIGADLFHFIAV
jgi:hypothetical protein